MFKFQLSEYEVHQVGSKDAGSKNFSFLAPETAEVVSGQFLPTAAMAAE
jgi:hypothetical protein